MQVETRFSTKVLVCQDVQRSLTALQRVVKDPDFATSADHDMKQVLQDP